MDAEQERRARRLRRSHGRQDRNSAVRIRLVCGSVKRQIRQGMWMEEDKELNLNIEDQTSQIYNEMLVFNRTGTFKMAFLKGFDLPHHHSTLGIETAVDDG